MRRPAKLEKEWEFYSLAITPHLAYPSVEGSVLPMRRLTGFGHSAVVIFTDRTRSGTWLYAKDDLLRVGKHFVENPDEVFVLGKRWKKYRNKFLFIMDENRDLPSLSDENLLDTYRRFYAAYVEEFAMLLFINGFEYYFQRLKEEKGISSEDFIRLTSPVKKDFVTQEVRELLAIPKDGRFDERIREHARKYAWLRNTYLGAKELDAGFFRERYRSESVPESVVVDKTDLIRRYGLDRRLIEAAEECVFLRDERKKHNLMGTQFLCAVFDELAKRRGEDPSLYKYVFPSEFPDIDREKAARRQDACLFIVTEEGCEAWDGQEARDRFAEWFPRTVPEGMVKGCPAFTGKRTGVARIMLTEKEFSRFKDGDILITSMTRPEFVPLMRKATAIVTDEGGITCHAAVLARELKVPCVVGTKHATIAFKDGDLIEVDADKGTVKKL